MPPPAKQKRTRAIRLPSRLVRTSYSPAPIGAHVGIPTGQPYSTVAISIPISFRSSLLKTCSQSRTGSAPLAFL
jgi:hypothetical protein